MPAAMRETRYDFYAPFAQGRSFAAAAARLAEDYRSARPFPHVVIDGFFTPDVLRTVVTEIPSPLHEPERLFRRHEPGLTHGKFAFRDIPNLGAASRSLIDTLNAEPFVEFLSTLTAIPGLISDPSLEGGGFHQIVRDGMLHVHADFNIHPVLRAQRRVNLLLYLNEGWHAEWGGALELWPQDMSAPARVILPLFNRMIIFGTTDTSYHGHPEPLACPPDVVRRSLALYYYTAQSPGVEEHSTLWQRRRADARTTV
jgi:hypothetical protein